MFFNRKATSVRGGALAGAGARAVAAICAARARIVVAPRRRRVRLARADSRDLREDRSGLVVLGHRRADREQGRRRRRLARRSPALSLRGVRLVVGRRRRRAGRRRLSAHRPSRARNRSPALAGHRRASHSCCCRAPRWRRCVSTTCRWRCRRRAGGALGEIIGRGLSRLLGFNGATLFLLALFAAGSLALLRAVVAEAHGAHRYRARTARAVACGGAPTSAATASSARRRWRCARRSCRRSTRSSTTSPCSSCRRSSTCRNRIAS